MKMMTKIYILLLGLASFTDSQNDEFKSNDGKPG